MRHSARAPIIAAALAGILLGVSAALLALTAPASAGPTQTPTPSPTGSPTPSPTASPTPTPYPQSTITIRFVRDGEPVEVFLFAPIHNLVADGDGCVVPVPGVAGFFADYSIVWPLLPSSSQPEPCSSGPPTTLRFEFHNGVTVFGTEFVWAGNDVTVDLEVPRADAGNTHTPTTTTIVTPGVMPDTGGRPEYGNGSEDMTLTVAVTIMALSGLLWLGAVHRRSE